MARNNILIAALMLMSIILIFDSSCFGREVHYQSAPWMVDIRKNSLHTDNHTGIVHHCTGVLYTANSVLTSRECIDMLPEHTQLIIYAGTNDWQGAAIQIFQPNGIYLSTNFASIGLVSSAVDNNYVNTISKCNRNCDISTYGFQFGWINSTSPYSRYQINLEVIEFDFTNSKSLCRQINENVETKLCAKLDDNTHSNTTQCDTNFGGEALMQVGSGQTLLVAFWEYDDCYENIRVFRKAK